MNGESQKGYQSYETETSSRVRSIRWLAILGGVAADMLASTALWDVYARAFMAEKVRRYGGVDQIPERALSQAELVALGLIGLAGTVFGGYIAGRLALRDEPRHGAVVAVASLVLGLGVELAVEGAVRLQWWEVALLLLMIPAGAFGGYLARATKNDKLA